MILMTFTCGLLLGLMLGFIGAAYLVGLRELREEKKIHKND